ncbi:MAG: MFS transporter [Chloroflexi bacterium]|nr:MFS transporter [Chloroflexota bacterium]
MGQPSKTIPPTTEPPRRRSVNIRTFSSLRHRDLRFLLGGTFFMSAGNWIQQVTVGWLAYDMTQSAFMVGAVMGTRSVPFLVAGPIGGVLGDRMDRKRILMATQVAQMVLALSLATLLAIDRAQVWHLFAFTLLTGVSWSIMNPVRMSLVANLVPKEDLMNALALNSAAFNINRAIGPALAGLLIAYAGPATNFFLQSTMYVGVLAVVIPMTVPPREYSAATETSVLSNFTEGIRYVRKERTILPLLIVAMIPSLFVMPFTQGILPVFSEEVLQGGSEGLGFLYSAGGIGGVVGTIIVASLGNFQRKGLLLLAGVTGAGTAMMIYSQMTWLPLAALLLALIGLSDMLFRSSNNTLIHSIVPDQYRSRVASILLMDNGLVPLGSLLAGTLAEFYGSPVAILVGGISTLAMVWFMAITFPVLRRA